MDSSDLWGAACKVDQKDMQPNFRQRAAGTLPGLEGKGMERNLGKQTARLENRTVTGAELLLAPDWPLAGPWVLSDVRLDTLISPVSGSSTPRA